MAEWLIASVLKTEVPEYGTVGSNPTLSAIFWGLSSFGRAVALQAIGEGFESLRLHHFLLTGSLSIKPRGTSTGYWLK